MTGVLVAVCAALAIPVGWVAWRLAQHFIDARPLEAGDTELRLPWGTTIGLEVVVFAGLAYRLTDQPRAVLAVYLALYFAFTVLLLVDFGRYYLPNQLVAATLVGGLIGVVAAWATVDQSAGAFAWSPTPALIGVAVNFVVYFVFWLIAQIGFGSRGLGFGDVKLAAPLGLALGWIAGDTRNLLPLVLWSVLIGFASGVVSSLVLLRGVKLRQSLPMGPFLVLGSVVVVVFSSSFIG